eukprot:323476-Lingulodinium_polyedra.AAC.1
MPCMGRSTVELEGPFRRCLSNDRLSCQGCPRREMEGLPGRPVQAPVALDCAHCHSCPLQHCPFDSD